MRRLIALRKRYRAFGRGASSSCYPSNPRCSPSSAATRTRRILVVANLSRFVQHVELDLKPAPEIPA